MLLVCSLLFHAGMAQTVETFILPNAVTGKAYNLSDDLNKKGVAIIFFSNQCPYAEYYLSRINQLNEQYASKGIRTILVNSNATQYSPDESIENMKRYANANGIEFPYLADKDKQVMRQLGAKRIPEVYLLDTSNGQFKVVYRGAIDDNPQSEGDVHQEYLNDAVVNLLSNKTISVKTTRAVGCLIK